MLIYCIHKTGYMHVALEVGACVSEFSVNTATRVCIFYWQQYLYIVSTEPWNVVLLQLCGPF